MTAEETYRAARAEGLDEVDACYAVKEAHGLTHEQVAELCWAIEARRAVPAWAHGDGRALTVAEKKEAAAWDAGAEPRSIVRR